MATSAVLQETPDFSLVLGGPIFQLFRRSHLAGDHLELLRRRIVAIVLVAWLPLLLLSMLGGHLLAGTVKLSFLQDIEGQVRFLVALPVLSAALVAEARRSGQALVIPKKLPLVDDPAMLRWRSIAGLGHGGTR